MNKKSNISAIQGLIDHKILEKDMVDPLEKELITFLIEKATMFEKNPQINPFFKDREFNLKSLFIIANKLFKEAEGSLRDSAFWNSIFLAIAFFLDNNNKVLLSPL